MLKDKGPLNDPQRDVLKNIGAAAASNAAAAMRKMTGRKVELSNNRVVVLPIADILDHAGLHDDASVNVGFRVLGDVKMYILLTMDIESARRLAFDISGHRNTEDDFDAMDSSAIKEFANIVAGAYLNALGMVCGLKMVHSIPQMSVDAPSAVIEDILANIQAGDDSIFWENGFGISSGNASIRLYIFPEEKGIATIVNAAGPGE